MKTWRWLSYWLVGIAVITYLLTISLRLAGRTAAYLPNSMTVSPFAYRILQFYVVRIVHLFIPNPDMAIVTGIALMSLFSITIWLLTSYSLYTKFYGERLALLGVGSLTGLFLVTLIPMTTRQLDIPTSWFEAACFAIGLNLLADWSTHPRPLLYGVLVVIGTLNRETAAILVAWYWLAVTLTTHRKNDWLLTISYGSIWLVLVVGLRLLIQIPSTRYTISAVFEQNLADIGLSIPIVALFLGPWPILMAHGRKTAATLFRQTRWGIYLYALMFFVFGIWFEIRVLIPVTIVAVGLGLASIETESQTSEPVL